MATMGTEVGGAGAPSDFVFLLAGSAASPLPPPLFFPIVLLYNRYIRTESKL